MLSIIADRQETEGAWINIKMTQWKLIPVLNVNELDEEILDHLAIVFEKFKDLDFGRIPEQYNKEKSCYNLRLDLDKLFLNALQIDVDKEDISTMD